MTPSALQAPRASSSNGSRPIELTVLGAGGPGPGAPLAPIDSPDGRAEQQVAVGRFGAVVFRQTLGDGSIHRVGEQWDDIEDEWLPVELPARKGRPGSRADGAWSSAHDCDFVANVYAAVVTVPHEVGRAARRSALRPNQILLYLAGRPAMSWRS